MKNEIPFTRSGTFHLGESRSVYGELYLNGEDSAVHLRDQEFLFVKPDQCACIHGVLHDMTKVTLFNCIAVENAASSSRGNSQYHFARLFPHFVITGDSHITADGRDVKSIEFVVEDATSLFYDFEAFGSVIDSSPYIEEIANANNIGPRVNVGTWPKIVYFTGKHDIMVADTHIGTIAARHNPSWGMGSPRGVRIDNSISVTITPTEATTFDDLFDRMLLLLRFFEIVIGRIQIVKEVWLHIASDDAEVSPTLRLHWSHSPTRDIGAPERDHGPHPGDMLLMPAQHPEVFGKVMKNWLAVDLERRDARLRFASSFAYGREYLVERLIGAANMFDILPSSAVPKATDLKPEVIDARTRCREILTPLPPSQERNSVLDALGRLGRSSLRHKIRFRAKYIKDVVGDRFPELERVVDAAVNCRNHYVHGSESKITYSDHFGIVMFFIDTLEFIFAASELVEAGWDIKEWLERGTVMSHPFGRYRVSYELSLQAFENALVPRTDAVP